MTSSKRGISMASELKGLRIAFLTSNEGVEQAELTAPWQAVKDAGGTAELIAPRSGEVQAFNHLEAGDTFTVHRTLQDTDVTEYDAVVVPGGVANGDFLRGTPGAVRFMQRMFEARKPAAVICHGPWVLVEGDLVRGRTLTSWPTLQTDIRNAGGRWVDTEVQVDENAPNTLITSRKPDDLPAFCETLVQVFARQSQAA
jgi:protease I